jgi:nitrite reductase/ring-hydroxylating ferredoxin subunit
MRNGDDINKIDRRAFLASASAACACMFCPDHLAAIAAETAGPINVGAMEDFSRDGVVDKWATTHGFFVIRADGRLYASSSICTHRSSVHLIHKEDRLACPQHGSLFTLAGVVTKGPARKSLPRYGISLSDRREVVVDTSLRFEPDHWDERGAYLTV